MHAYVVNMARSPDRRAHITRELRKTSVRLRDRDGRRRLAVNWAWPTPRSSTRRSSCEHLSRRGRSRVRPEPPAPLPEDRRRRAGRGIDPGGRRRCCPLTWTSWPRKWAKRLAGARSAATAQRRSRPDPLQPSHEPARCRSPGGRPSRHCRSISSQPRSTGACLITREACERSDQAPAAFDPRQRGRLAVLLPGRRAGPALRCVALPAGPEERRPDPRRSAHTPRPRPACGPGWSQPLLRHRIPVLHQILSADGSASTGSTGAPDGEARQHALHRDAIPAGENLPIGAW